MSWSNESYTLCCLCPGESGTVRDSPGQLRIGKSISIMIIIQYRSQRQDTVSRLLVVLAGDCAALVHEESVFYRIQDWVDFRSVLNAEEACQQMLIDALRPAKALGQTASIT